MPRKGEVPTAAKLAAFRANLSATSGAKWLAASSAQSLVQFVVALARIRRSELQKDLRSLQRPSEGPATSACVYLGELLVAVVAVVRAEVTGRAVSVGTPLQTVLPIIAAAVAGVHDVQLARVVVPSLVELVACVAAVAPTGDAAAKTTAFTDAEVDLQRDLVSRGGVHWLRRWRGTLFYEVAGYTVL